MRKALFTLTILLGAVALVAVSSGSAMAQVTGLCTNCHTMHNSQDGVYVARPYGGATPSEPEELLTLLRLPLRPRDTT
jgi:hypothetical protein